MCGVGGLKCNVWCCGYGLMNVLSKWCCIENIVNDLKVGYVYFIFYILELLCLFFLLFC